MSNEITEKFVDATGRIEADLAQYTILNMIEQKTRVPKTIIAVSSALVLFTTIYAMFGPGLLCNLVGFVYPTYASFKAIETKRKDDDTQWLTYWVVYATFTVLESFIDLLLFWFPFYYSFKFGFLIWMFAPNTKGAKFVYQHFLNPVFKNMETAAVSVNGEAKAKRDDFESDGEKEE